MDFSSQELLQCPVPRTDKDRDLNAVQVGCIIDVFLQRVERQEIQPWIFPEDCPLVPLALGPSSSKSLFARMLLRALASFLFVVDASSSEAFYKGALKSGVDAAARPLPRGPHAALAIP
eukprot:2521396-Amphidinium_carterae.3